MVKECDLPIRTGTRQFFLQPIDLFLVHVVAVQGKETDTFARLERVEPLTVHIEVLVEPLIWVIVIPQRGVEFHPTRQQPFIRAFELLHKIVRLLAAVKVIPHHENNIEGKRAVKTCKLFGDLILLMSAGSRVANDSEMEG